LHTVLPYMGKWKESPSKPHYILKGEPMKIALTILVTMFLVGAVQAQTKKQAPTKNEQSPTANEKQQEEARKNLAYIMAAHERRKAALLDILKSFNECWEWMGKESEAKDAIKADEVLKYAKRMRENVCALSEQK
jgi:hypothetical protein